jgi:hypothetical protein
LGSFGEGGARSRVQGARKKLRPEVVRLRAGTSAAMPGIASDGVREETKPSLIVRRLSCYRQRQVPIFQIPSPQGRVRHYCRFIAPVGKTNRPVRRILVTSYSNAVPQRRQT